MKTNLRLPLHFHRHVNLPHVLPHTEMQCVCHRNRDKVFCASVTGSLRLFLSAVQLLFLSLLAFRSCLFNSAGFFASEFLIEKISWRASMFPLLTTSGTALSVTNYFTLCLVIFVSSLITWVKLMILRLESASRRKQSFESSILSSFFASYPTSCSTFWTVIETFAHLRSFASLSIILQAYNSARLSVGIFCKMCGKLLKSFHFLVAW